MLNTLYNDIKDNINDLPTLTWIKDSNYRYIASSNRLTKLLGCHSKKSFCEQDDFNQPWAKYAELYRGEDNQVISGKLHAFLHPIKLFTGEEFLVITRKFPLYDNEKKVVGIMGNMTIATSPEFVRNISTLQKNDFEISAATNIYEPYRYQIADIFPSTTLSERECACLFYLIRGKTAPEIAKLLFISKRTVEHHINNIKNKFNCNTKSEIIEKAFSLGLVSFIPNTFLYNQFDKFL